MFGVRRRPDSQVKTAGPTGLISSLRVNKTEDLNGKAVFITGSSTGIGAAAARGFSKQGAKVILHYNVNKEAAEQVFLDIMAAGGEARLVGENLSKPEMIQPVVDNAADAFGGLDVLINNAGTMLGRIPTLEMDDAHFRCAMPDKCRALIVYRWTSCGRRALLFAVRPQCMNSAE